MDDDRKTLAQDAVQKLKDQQTDRAADLVKGLSKNRLDWGKKDRVAQGHNAGYHYEDEDEGFDRFNDDYEEEIYEEEEAYDDDPEDGDGGHMVEEMAQAQPLPQRVQTQEEKDQAARIIAQLAEKNKKTPEERAADADALMRKMASGDLKREKEASAMQTMRRHLREKPELDRIKKAKAKEIAEKWTEERPRIEAERLVRATSVMTGHIVRRVAKDGVLSHGVVGRLVKKREFLNDHKVTKENDFVTVYKSPNVQIVYYPPQYRTIQTARNKYRLPFPYVIFVHVQYNNADFRKARGTGRQAGNQWHNELYVGFAKTQPNPDNLRRCMVSAPPLPHVYEEGNICMGAIYKNGKPLKQGDLTGPENGLTIENLIDTFWNNRFVYEQKGRLRYNRWQAMTPEQMLDHNWADDGHWAHRLDRFPPRAMKRYRDYVVEEQLNQVEGTTE